MGAVIQGLSMKRPIALILYTSACLCSVTGAGLYTASQAQQGAVIYARQCAVCHGDTLAGGAGPALKGMAFNEMATSEHLTIKSLLDVTSRTMPLTAPGSLKQEEYAALTAFILQQSGFPAGDEPLSEKSANLGDVGLGIDAATASPLGQQSAAPTTAAAMRTASQGVYTDAQMAQGKGFYSDNCLQCHGGELDGAEDAPPLAGKLFLSKWGGLPVGTLHAFIDKSMPPGNGGALGAVSEAAVVAYILYKNNFPSGSTPLPADPAGLNRIITK
jgi:mono/diheme cytochrome c family protein